MNALRSCLDLIVPPAPMHRADLELLRQRAWTEQGIVCLHVTELGDNYLRQSLVNEATRRWGRRMRK